MSAANGGPAFPCDRIPTSSGTCITSDGMTLRDYFAAKAMQALVAKSPLVTVYDDDSDPAPLVAKGAYDYADAMLAAREAVGPATQAAREVGK